MNEGEHHNNVETKLTGSSFCSRIKKLDPPPKKTKKKHSHTQFGPCPQVPSIPKVSGTYHGFRLSEFI